MRRKHCFRVIKRCCSIHNFWVPLYLDLFIMLRPRTNFCWSSSIEFRSREPFMIRKLYWHWMYGRAVVCEICRGWCFRDKEWYCVHGFTLNNNNTARLVSSEIHTCSWQSFHTSKRFCVPETDKNIRFKLSINALTKGRATLPVDTNFWPDEDKVYSITTFICARKRIIDKVHPVKIPLKCWCQLLGADWEKERL